MLRRSIFFSLVIALLACCSCSYRLGHSYHRTISHFTSRGFRLSNSVNARRTNSRQDVAVSTPKTGAGRVGTATKISGTINQKPHTPFPGGKTPSKSEQKARFNLDMNRPRVQRLYSPEERVETTALSVGQKLVGRVISVTE